MTICSTITRRGSLLNNNYYFKLITYKSTVNRCKKKMNNCHHEVNKD